MRAGKKLSLPLWRKLSTYFSLFFIFLGLLLSVAAYFFAPKEEFPWPVWLEEIKVGFLCSLLAGASACFGKGQTRIALCLSSMGMICWYVLAANSI
jgi:hypothetical protein